MKKQMYLALMVLLLPACALFSPRQAGDEGDVLIQHESDSTEYDLVVMDQGFDSWFLMQPTHQHSLEYYKNKNAIHVREWNYRYAHPRRYGDLYSSYIDYDPYKHYGLEFERKLYYYFRYFETVNGVRLDPGF
jgi:hypothetical protein